MGSITSYSRPDDTARLETHPEWRIGRLFGDRQAVAKGGGIGELGEKRQSSFPRALVLLLVPAASIILVIGVRPLAWLIGRSSWPW
jgi:hypothetical protein